MKRHIPKLLLAAGAYMLGTRVGRYSLHHEWLDVIGGLCYLLVTVGGGWMWALDRQRKADQAAFHQHVQEINKRLPHG